MSVPEFHLFLTGPARKDFRDILSFTEQNWGSAQRIVYKSKIDKALKMILDNPQMGRKKHGHLFCRVERHHIFYDVKGVTITVLRILHQRMDVTRHLDS